MNTTDKDYRYKDDEALEALFKHGSSRTRAPKEVEEEVRHVLHRQWTEQTRQRRRRKKVVNWAIAASIILAVFVVTNGSRNTLTDAQAIKLATAEKTTGDVFVQKPGERHSKKLASAQLMAGDKLSTIEGSRIAFRWGNGESIRLDQNSRIELVSAAEIRLLSGKIYVDSADAVIKEKAFRIRTSAGQVSHVGTQYMTELAGDDLFVSVRVGEVSVGNSHGALIARKGQRLKLSTDGQRLVTNIPLYGEDWQWTEQVAPGFNMDGHSLKELLDWVGRETGLQIEYGSAESKIAAAQTQLFGQVDLEPLRAMELVLQTSDLTHVLKDGVILVSL